MRRTIVNAIQLGGGTVYITSVIKRIRDILSKDLSKYEIIVELNKILDWLLD